MSAKRLSMLLAGVALAAATNAQGFAIEHVNVIPMDTERVLKDHTVLVDGEAIVWVGPAADAEIPSDATRIDGTGKTLIPGLIDVHLGLLAEQHVRDDFAATELGIVAANGVTTARLMNGRPSYLMLRDQVLAENLPLPTLYVASPPLTTRPVGRVPVGVVPQDSQAAQELVREYAASGYDFIQLGFDLRPTTHAMIVQEARAQSLPVTGRLGWKTGLETGLLSGMQVEHLDQFFEWLMPEPATRGPSAMNAWRARYWGRLPEIEDARVTELARFVAESGTYHTPAVLYHKSAYIDRRSSEEIDAERDGRFIAVDVKESLFHAREQFERSRPDQGLIDLYAHLRGLIVRELDAAGVPLLAGSSAPEWGHIGGFALHDELGAMVEVGLSPWTALATATRNPAKYLGREGELGVVAIGAQADLVLLDADPLEDIANAKKIAGVALRGRWYGPKELSTMLDTAAATLSKADLRPGTATQR